MIENRKDREIMSILEDLDLLDLPDDLPDGLDFDLDCILEEFGFSDSPEASPETSDDLMPEPELECPPEMADHAEPTPRMEDPVKTNEILYDFDLSEDDEDVKVYSPGSSTRVQAEPVPPESATQQVSTQESQATVLFDAAELPEVPETPMVSQTPTQPAQKAPGFFAKLAGMVAGVFHKAPKKPTPAVQPNATDGVAEEPDPFANLADLFADSSDLGESDGMDALMLELELLAEQEAEKEAEVAAREAAERLAREEAEKKIELEAQRLAQEEADRQAREAAEAAALQAQQEQEDARLEAQSEEELFDWIESTAKRRAMTSPVPPMTESVPVEEPDPAFTLDMPGEPTESAEAFSAMDLPTDEKVSASTLSMDLPEESVEDADALLEAPDIDPEATITPEESPEEAAARKKKEEDALHYTPEESTAKTITSHIGKRFGAAFAAFSESGNDPGDREEDLGPELPASKAYRYFSQYVNGYRFRLRVSVVMSVILGWISLGLPVLGSLNNPAVAAGMCLMILLTVMLAGVDILATGVRTLLQRRPGLHSLVAISCVASVIDAIVIILTQGQAGYLPFCGVSAVSMCFAIYGSLLYCRSQRLNFKTLDMAAEPMTISVDYGIVDEDATTVYRTPGHPEGYIHHSEEEDLSEAVFGLMAPILIPAIPVLALIAALLSKSFGDFFHILAAMFAAAASFSAMVSFPLPYFLVQRELYSAKAAIAGWTGTKEIGRVSTMIVTDRDLFPDETVSIKSVRIVDGVPPQLTLSYMCSLIHVSGSCLVPAFAQLAENNDCELFQVENFQCHEAGGLSGDIGPDHVLVASHSYMKLQGFRIPARKKDSENALFLAVNGHVIAYIIMEYQALRSVRDGLESALRGTAEMIFAARDFNVTPLLISKKFKSATETLRFPSYSQRFDITSRADSDTATCAAVVYRKSFYSYAVVVEKARNLYKSVSWAVTLSAVSSIMGVVLMFIMAITGAGGAVTVGRLLIFMLLWLVTTLGLAVSITK